MAALDEIGELGPVSEADCLAVRMAALLHDIGHYPFSHALEEAGFPSHEALGVAKLSEGELHARLTEIGGRDFPRVVGELITGTSRSPLQGLISGSIDLDKIDYLSRDARMCGVPYGTVDVDRLLSSLTLVEATPGRFEVGVQEKGVSALESLLFAKYQMYRNVYWHHAVRSATCMFKRAVRMAVRRGSVTVQAIADATDDGLMELLISHDRNELASCIRARRLHKRALDLPASEVPGDVQPWVAGDPDLLERVEDAIGEQAGLPPGGVLLDYPARTRHARGQHPLPHPRWLHRAADRRLKSGSSRPSASGRRAIPQRPPSPHLCIESAQPPAEPVLSMLTWPADEVEKRLAAEASLI